MSEYDGDRPVTMTVKDGLVRRMSVDMKISESIVHRVIDHQVNSMKKAFDVNNSVEISGFGKFVFNKKKVMRKINGCYEIKKRYEETLNDKTLPERKRVSVEFKLHKLMLDVEAMKKKL